MRGFIENSGAGQLKFWSAPVDVMAGGRSLFRSDNARAVLSFSRESVANSVLRAPDALKFGEAYLSGQMDIEGDIYEAILLKEHFYPEALGLRDKGRIVLDVLLSYRKHTLDNDRNFISHHYEHPGEFYRLFLGDSMTYSCAYFNNERTSLDGAQEKKISHLLSKLHIQRGDRLLDIGCGWGSLVIQAAREHDVTALGITLSRTQHDYANKRLAALGLRGKCRVELQDYRDVQAEPRFDKIVSVGMYEHVGRRNLSAYFKKVNELLRPDGLFVNHGITAHAQGDWRKASEARFIDKYIFPGGELHSCNKVVGGMEAAAFEIFDVESLRKHYAKTLRCWVENLQRNAEAARKLVPESVFRAWVLYMAGCALTFEEGYLNVHQICGSKTGRYGGRDIPMTRAHLYSPQG